MKQRGLYFSVIALISIFAGCGTDEKRTSDDSLLVVNGYTLAKKDVDEQVDFRVALARASGQTTEAEIDNDEWRQNVERSVYDGFVQDALFMTAAESYFATNDVAVRAEAESRIRAEMVTNIVNATRGLTMGDVATNLNERQKAAYERKLSTDCTIEAYFQTAWKDKIYMTPEAVTNAVAAFKAYNEMVAVTNAATYQLATNVWREAAAGADFTELVKKHSYDPDDYLDGKMGQKNAADFSGDEELWNMLWEMPDGGITPPTETFEGLEIFKVVRHLSETESESETPSLELERIFFRRGISVIESEPDVLKRDLEKDFRQRAMQQVLKEEWERATVQSPVGADKLPSFAWKRMKDFPKGTEKKGPAK